MAKLRRMLSLLLCAALVVFAFGTISGENPLHDAVTQLALYSTLLTMPEAVPSVLRASAEKQSTNKTPSTRPETLQPPKTTAEEPKLVTADPAEAIGRIVPKTIALTTANLALEHVHINNKTGLQIDLQAEKDAGVSVRLEATDAPQVLIMHTHATESYLLEDRDFYVAQDTFRSTDETLNVIKVGDAIAGELTAAGIGVLHDKTLHDHPSYTGSYNRSEVTVKRYLQQYPSIKIVLDVHRDAVGGDDYKTRPVAMVDGKQAAQVMLVMGSESGKVTGHPNWRENFRLGVRFQEKLERDYGDLMRPMHFVSSRYNQHLSTGSMLLEMGSDGNTLEEAVYAGELVGKALAELLRTL